MKSKIKSNKQNKSKQNRRDRQNSESGKGCLQESQINRRTGYSALNIDQRYDAGP